MQHDARWDLDYYAESVSDCIKTGISSVVKVSKTATETWVFSKSICYQNLGFSTVIEGFKLGHMPAHCKIPLHDC